MNIRYWFYLAVITAYVTFGVIEGWYDIFPWGAVIIGVCIALAEIGTWWSIKKRNK